VNSTTGPAGSFQDVLYREDYSMGFFPKVGVGPGNQAVLFSEPSLHGDSTVAADDH